MTSDSNALFQPFRLGSVELRNRFAMAPMTRWFSPGGVPGERSRAYYRRRAESGIGLIISEGVFVDHPSAGQDVCVPRVVRCEGAWTPIVRDVQDAGAAMFCQLWHTGLTTSGALERDPGLRLIGPSGFMDKDAEASCPPMTLAEIDDVVAAFGRSAAAARSAGFDGIEIHGAHGYLIDQFMWSYANRRDDEYGGSLENRLRFAVDVVTACRAAVGPDYPISFRLSQWKIADYGARLAETPAELERIVSALADAGASIVHASTRRFREPEFAGSPLNLAGWIKKLIGVPVITVGSIAYRDKEATPEGLAESMRALNGMVERGEVDLAAVGRAVLSNSGIVNLLHDEKYADIHEFNLAKIRDYE